jgi:hypothetical protein
MPSFDPSSLWISIAISSIGRHTLHKRLFIYCPRVHNRTYKNKEKGGTPNNWYEVPFSTKPDLDSAEGCCEV